MHTKMVIVLKQLMKVLQNSQKAQLVMMPVVTITVNSKKLYQQQ